ncbi:MAG: LacI family DNA-binding transcriptional regulator, partial [Lachnospiraceae bacterium]|nr:LacI family DNA-binding transcriptional regulator [Lachnospiraceae bacterium]
MATIKEIAEIVGVSSAAVSRVLNYDEGISVSPDTRAAIFAAAEKVGYKKRVIYPKIDHVALLYFTEEEDELEDIFYQNIKEELTGQAEKMNIQLSEYTRQNGMGAIPKDLNAFVAIGWLNRQEINRLYQ